MTECVYYTSPIGLLLIKNSGNAISHVGFAESKRNPFIIRADASATPQTDIIKKCIGELEAYFDGKLKSFTVDLTQEGTPFQQSVWNALQTIGYGKTTSYLQLSKILGNVKAIRAVGTANGKNNIAIMVPCHRVIGSHGDLVGYAGDLWRKQWLLAHEARFAHGVQSLFDVPAYNMH